VSVHAQATELLSPLIADPAHSAVLLDVDGTLAPIVRHADDAMVAQPTRSLLSAIAKRYALVACISGRRATDTRRIVSIGSITYVGNHGGEVLPPSGGEVRVDPELRACTRDRHPRAAPPACAAGGQGLDLGLPLARRA
jgi:trehalose 6-phosphate phosphatase